LNVLSNEQLGRQWPNGAVNSHRLPVLVAAIWRLSHFLLNLTKELPNDIRLAFNKHKVRSGVTERPKAILLPIPNLGDTKSKFGRKIVLRKTQPVADCLYVNFGWNTDFDRFHLAARNPSRLRCRTN
jgi:hypothetical protein